MKLPDIEIVSGQVHAAWMDSKRAQGVTTRLAEDGEELMVPYSQLSEKAKDLDRGTVKAVYKAIEQVAERDAVDFVNTHTGRDSDNPAARDAFARRQGYANYQAYDEARDSAHRR